MLIDDLLEFVRDGIGDYMVQAFKCAELLLRAAFESRKIWMSLPHYLMS